MDVQKRFEEIFRSFLYEDWMDEEDYKELLEEVLKAAGTNYEDLYNLLMEGIANGIPAEEQFKVAEDILKNIKEQMDGD